ncbi:MAG: hypothetical protein M3378_01255 [Actinomycetota bacterium]|nr:hypothetical protein [Actinomycetota bacterium]
MPPTPWAPGAVAGVQALFVLSSGYYFPCGAGLKEHLIHGEKLVLVRTHPESEILEEVIDHVEAELVLGGRSFEKLPDCPACAARPIERQLQASLKLENLDTLSLFALWALFANPAEYGRLEPRGDALVERVELSLGVCTL